jgi:signal transduction histidine kinase
MMKDLSSRFTLASKAAAVFSCLMGCAVLAGWWFDIDLLRFHSPYTVRMKANAALGFILSGISLWLAVGDDGSRWKRSVYQGLAFLAALIGLLTLFEYAFGWDLGIDQLLAYEPPGAVKTSSPGRIAPNAALNFLLLGTALLLLPARRCEWIVSIMVLAAGVVSLLALMAYAYAAETLHGFASYMHIGLNTALTFLVLSMGVLFSLRRRGLMAILSSEGPAGEIARRLLPPVFVFPFALGWARLQAQRMGAFGTEFGVAILVTSTIVILAVVVWRATLALNRTEAARRQVEEALRRQTDELSRSNAELEKFAYVASHDLQEPLRMISGFSQLLARRFEGKLGADADEYIGFVVDGANRMQRLINDLLRYSRVGTRGGAFEPTGCSSVLEEALDNLGIALRESGAEIRRDPLPTLTVDRSQMVQLFQNLVGNALKFRGGERTRIQVSARQNGEEWIFSVADNGIGIDPKYFDRIFTIFQRLHGKIEYPGTGIGLAICKKIVERHGGRIWLESELGKGCTFFFTLPAIRRSGGGH